MKITILAIGLFISAQASALNTKAIVYKPLLKEQYSSPFFLFLRGHKQGKGYSLQWSMSSNTGIEKFEIQYTYEDPTDPYSNWYTAGWVNNLNQNIFKYTDMGAIQGTINYRIIAILTNNSGTVVSGIYTCVIGQ